MEESKNPSIQRTSDNFYITDTLKTVDFTKKKKIKIRTITIKFKQFY